MVTTDLTRFQIDLLRMVELMDDPHGLGIKHELEYQYDDGTEIHHGRLYPNLDTLIEAGLVEKGQKDRRTNVYSVTGTGKQWLDARRAFLVGSE